MLRNKISNKNKEMNYEKLRSNISLRSFVLLSGLSICWTHISNAQALNSWIVKNKIAN